MLIIHRFEQKATIGEILVNKLLCQIKFMPNKFIKRTLFHQLKFFWLIHIKINKDRLISSLLRSRYWGRHAMILSTNGCSLEHCIPFPLLLRTNNMHVTVNSCVNHISRYICRQRPGFQKMEAYSLLVNLRERNVELV